MMQRPFGLVPILKGNLEDSGKKRSFVAKPHLKKGEPYRNKYSYLVDSDARPKLSEVHVPIIEECFDRRSFKEMITLVSEKDSESYVIVLNQQDPKYTYVKDRDRFSVFISLSKKMRLSLEQFSEKDNREAYKVMFGEEIGESSISEFVNDLLNKSRKVYLHINFAEAFLQYAHILTKIVVEGKSIAHNLIEVFALNSFDPAELFNRFLDPSLFGKLPSSKEQWESFKVSDFQSDIFEKFNSIEKKITTGLKKLPDVQFLIENLMTQVLYYVRLSVKVDQKVEDLKSAMLELFSTLLTTLVDQGTFRKLFAAAKNDIQGTSQEMEDMKEWSILGIVPFLVGTLYQIIADIISTIASLLYFGFKGAQSLIGYFFSEEEESSEYIRMEESSLMKVFLGTDSLEEFLSNLLENAKNASLSVARLLNDWVNDFILKAKEYGTYIAELINENADYFTPKSGMLSLLEDYPKNPTLLDRFWWSLKAWFNLGRTIGPIIVDIILMFCGGAGIFSALTKVAGIKRVKSSAKITVKFIEKLQKKFSKLYEGISKDTREQIEEFLLNLHGIAGDMVEHLKLLLEKVRSASDKVDMASKKEVEKIIERIDGWYDKASLTNFVLTMFSMFLVGDELKINEEGEVAV